MRNKFGLMKVKRYLILEHYFQIRPIVAGFKSVRDKENILRHCTSSKILKTRGELYQYHVIGIL